MCSKGKDVMVQIWVGGYLPSQTGQLPYLSVSECWDSILEICTGRSKVVPERILGVEIRDGYCARSQTLSRVQKF
eukprot:3887134-Rhodomonas_salina.4